MWTPKDLAETPRKRSAGSRLRRAGVAAALLTALALGTGSAGAAVTLDAAMKDVERIRNLAFVEQVRTVTISRKDLARHLNDQIAKSLPYSFDEYMLILKALRLIDPSTTNAQLKMLSLMQQQVLAFYDPLTHTYVAIDTPPELPPGVSPAVMEQAVAVHELVHALQDQRFAIGKTEKELRRDTDASMAFHALVEGEASLVMLGKMIEPMGQTLDSLVKNQALAAAIANAATMMKADAETPRYFTEALGIPYTAGLRFVVEAYRKGGWDLVNRIYEAPPTSMREILHPEEFLAGKRTANPFPLRPPVEPGHLLTVERLGEWHWSFLVGADNARGWKGDRVTIGQDAHCNPTVLVETEWESPERARAFETAYTAFLRGKDLEPSVRVSGSRVDVAYGHDDALIERFISKAASPAPAGALRPVVAAVR